MKLQTEFEEFISQKKLFVKSDKILLAVSGGVDSVVMTELFHRCKFKFAIAHCNFQLRGDESDGDEMFVKKLAEKYDVPFFSVRFETSKASESLRLSIQETARKLRYDWFTTLLKEKKYKFVATAHHLNDSIETFFINLLRGTGVSGLRGIQPLIKEAGIIRPLLFAKKDALEKFAEAEKISFRLDHSNETDLYLRNRLRHHLIPVLSQFNQDFENVMERTLQNLAFAESIVEETVAKEFLAGFNKDHSSLSIGLNKLQKHEFPLAMLMAIVQRFGFNFSQVGDIWNAKTPGKQVFSGEYSLTADRGKFILTKIKSPSDPLHYLNESDTRYEEAGYQLAFQSRRKIKDEDYIIPENRNAYILDKDKLSFPLIIRKWQQGDFFYPLGMRGRKKISDFLTDRKVSRPDKEKTYVLLSGEKIVCLVGHRIDDRFKVTDKTKEIYQVDLKYK